MCSRLSVSPIEIPKPEFDLTVWPSRRRMRQLLKPSTSALTTHVSMPSPYALWLWLTVSLENVPATVVATLDTVQEALLHTSQKQLQVLPRGAVKMVRAQVSDIVKIGDTLVVVTPRVSDTDCPIGYHVRPTDIRSLVVETSNAVLCVTFDGVATQNAIMNTWLKNASIGEFKRSRHLAEMEELKKADLKKADFVSI